ncbi:hypothetical protein AABB24_001309, partial [Solanum stoloniferum]
TPNIIGKQNAKIGHHCPLFSNQQCTAALPFPLPADRHDLQQRPAAANQRQRPAAANQRQRPVQSRDQMDDSMKQLQEKLIEVEIEGESLLLARQQLVENDRLRNGNREALTALRRRAKTTKTSVPTPFESIMRDVESRPLVKEVCPTCGNHDSKEKTWVMFPGTDVFANIPFHAAHTILEKDQTLLNYEANKLQSVVKEKSLWISDQGVLVDTISPGVLRSMVTLSDKPKIAQNE